MVYIDFYLVVTGYGATYYAKLIRATLGSLIAGLIIRKLIVTNTNRLVRN